MSTWGIVLKTVDIGISATVYCGQSPVMSLVGSNPRLVMLRVMAYYKQTQLTWISGDAASESFGARFGMIYRKRRPGAGRKVVVGIERVKTKTVSIRLPLDAFERLSELCVTQNKTQAEVFTAALGGVS